ncbi:TrmH family RNA methyltransferase [Crocinitomix algicola]|uniref:TrmH family RNA methyltransferase n=1 Tax=Crocinitomix algicola TaxID=1740263 RepID=UPI00082A2BDC|nr:RNA methyltransferase [Crocinitomix algicola]
MSLSKNEIKLVKSLQIKKYRDLNRLFVVEGVKLVDELFQQSHFKIDGVFYTKDYHVQIPNHLHSFLVSDNELARISGLKAPNKVLAVVKYPKDLPINFDEENIILALDTINDPGNLGTIIRTADWFGIKQIIASKATVDLFNPKVIQSSMGAVYRMNYHRTDLHETLNQLKAANYTILGAALGGESLYQTEFNTKTVLLMGSESHGIDASLNHLINQHVQIPQFGKTESLNVAMATGIILSHYRQNKP